MIVNQWAGMRVSRGWLVGSHRNNPAIDYPVAKGSPVYAPAAGRASLRNWGGSRAAGDPGNKFAVYLPDGRSIHIAHLDSFVVKHGEQVQAGDLIGYSGNTGNVEPVPTKSNPGAGSHIHTFGLLANGARWNWTQDAGAMPAGGEDDDMSAAGEARIIQILENVEASLLGDGGDRGPDNARSIATRIEAIHSRVNFANRGGDPSKPYLIAVQGDVDTILAAIAGIDGADLDLDKLSDLIGQNLGADVARELGKRLQG